MTITIEQAQSQAAEICLTILTDAGLIGENLITKLPAARAAILEALPKMYAACRQVEGDTRKNMFLVSEVVSQMFGRAKWADHDKMMDAVEAGLKALVLEAQEEVLETQEAEASEAMEETVRNGVEGMTVRINTLTQFLHHEASPEHLEEYLITSELGTVAFTPEPSSETAFAPHPDLRYAPGFKREFAAMEMAGQTYKVTKRRDAIQEVIDSTRQALAQCEKWLEDREAKAAAVTVEVTEEATHPTADPLAGLIQSAKDSRDSLNDRLYYYQSRICALPLDKLNEFIIVSRTEGVAYDASSGSLTPCQDLIFAPGSTDEVGLWEGLPENLKVQKRIHAMQDVIDRSKKAMKQVERFLEGEA